MPDLILNGVHISFRNSLDDVSLKRRNITTSTSRCVKTTCFLTEEFCLRSSHCGSHLAVFKIDDGSFLTVPLHLCLKTRLKKVIQIVHITTLGFSTDSTNDLWQWLLPNAYSIEVVCNGGRLILWGSEASLTSSD